MKTLTLLDFAPLALVALAACASESDAEDTDSSGGMTETTEADDSSSPTSGTAPVPTGGTGDSTAAGGETTAAPNPTEGGDDSTDGGDDSTGEPGVSGQCGDVIAADHPPFEAIERLATTDEEVRILVFGQSISEQDWWLQTRDWLQQQYPGGNLVMEEHALGGCSSACLIGHTPWSVDGQQFNRLPQEVFAWRPDLIIFHVFGDHVDYGYIMRSFTEGCAAFEDYETWDGQQIDAVGCTAMQEAMSEGYELPEVLVQNDHRWNGNYPQECPDNPGPSEWACFTNEVTVPGYALEWGYELQDNWHRWAEYIEANDIDPTTLTMAPNDVHLSEAGNQVMFEMTVPHLCYSP